LEVGAIRLENGRYAPVFEVGHTFSTTWKDAVRHADFWTTRALRKDLRHLQRGERPGALLMQALAPVSRQTLLKINDVFERAFLEAMVLVKEQDPSEMTDVVTFGVLSRNIIKDRVLLDRLRTAEVKSR
jgi:hypothetical protein